MRYTNNKPLYTCAVDLGASGGRVMVGEWNGKRVKIDEIHRFPNEPVAAGGILYWDILRLFHEIKTGLRKIAAKKIPLSAIGIDAWGVDYGLLDKQGNVIGAPIHYRDSRTDGIPEELKLPLEEVYARTGIQLMQINTLFQLAADAKMRPAILENAQRLLFIPDLIGYFLTGASYNEYTVSSTSQLLNATGKTWENLLPDMINTQLFSPVVMPGTVIGPLSGEVLAETGLNADVRLIAVGSHDTASAVAGTPMFEPDAAYLSSGTWSLLGMELDEPDRSPESFRHNFTNEGGIAGKIRYLKNINGLWLIQQLRRHYNAAGASYSFSDLACEAENAADTHFCITPNDPLFMNPVSMPDVVREYCERTGQGTPCSAGETAMAVYNGLANEYAATLRELEALRNINHNEGGAKTLHIVGGGARDTLLCRLTAQRTSRRVLAGPVEASVLGNIAVQWMGLGMIDNLQQGREIIRYSFAPQEYGNP